MNIDIDAIEARANAAGVFNNQKELLKVFSAAEASLVAAAQSALMELQDVTLRAATEELKADNAALCAEVRELRAAIGLLQGEVETIINTEPHEDVCLVTRGGDCTCWQARLQTALDGDK